MDMDLYGLARDVIDKISYKDWEFHLKSDGGNLFLQIQFLDRATNDWQYCRMWYLWPGMGESGVVKTVWSAVLAAEEHEAREMFRYQGVKVFNPHLDIEVLVKEAKWKANIAETDDPK